MQIKSRTVKTKCIYKMTNTYNFAEKELDILSKSSIDLEDRPLIEPFKEEILALCEKFGGSGQSGGSAPYTAFAISQAIKSLLLQEPICPIMGIDEEWMNVTKLNEGDVLYQNMRCSALFKEGRNALPYYLDAIVWKGDRNGDSFTGKVEGINSRQYIKGFSFTPKTFYINVKREILPDDWIEEPFYENKFYDEKVFKETGVKEWKIEKYRYLIKDKKQLDKVFKYYNKK